MKVQIESPSLPSIKGATSTIAHSPNDAYSFVKDSRESTNKTMLVEELKQEEKKRNLERTLDQEQSI